MAYAKTIWVDGETIADAQKMNNIENGIEANETASNNLTENLNTVNENLEQKLDKASVKTTQTSSDADTYSCNYINNIKRINNAYLLGFAGKSSLKVHSTTGYGIFIIVGSTNMSIVQFTGPNGVPNVYDVYGTHPFSVSISANVVTLSSLNTWDHYILIGSNEIINVEV